MTRADQIGVGLVAHDRFKQFKLDLLRRYPGEQQRVQQHLKKIARAQVRRGHVQRYAPRPEPIGPPKAKFGNGGLANRPVYILHQSVAPRGMQEVFQRAS
ncbi:MAG: hypothetical protein AAGA70_07455 [Pseudomonadota bacterium]